MGEDPQSTSSRAITERKCQTWLKHTESSKAAADAAATPASTSEPGASGTSNKRCMQLVGHGYCMDGFYKKYGVVGQYGSTHDWPAAAKTLDQCKTLCLADAVCQGMSYFPKAHPSYSCALYNQPCSKLSGTALEHVSYTRATCGATPTGPTADEIRKTEYVYAANASTHCPRGYVPITDIKECRGGFPIGDSHHAAPAHLLWNTDKTRRTAQCHVHWPGSGCFAFNGSLYFSNCAGRPLTQHGYKGICKHPGAKMVVTHLTVSARQGDIEIQVASTSGFKNGAQILIDHERNTIVGFGSIRLLKPLAHAHPAGTTVMAQGTAEEPNAAPVVTPEVTQVIRVDSDHQQQTPPPATPAQPPNAFAAVERGA